MNLPSPRPADDGRSGPLRIFIVTAAGTVVALVGLSRFWPTCRPTVATLEMSAAAEGPSVNPEAGSPETPATSASLESAPASALDLAATLAAAAPEAIHPEAQRLMTRLTSALALLTGKENAASQAQALEEWKSGLRELASLGPAGIPAILKFLAEGADVRFSRELRADLGHGSARTGLIQALRQIGGPEAVSAMSGILERTQSYQELALLAQGLEEADPGGHRSRVVDLARGELTAAATAAAASGSSADAPDVAPLFEVLGHYGGPDTARDLEAAAGRWKYYAMSALARLPEGAGVPSLIRLADPTAPGANRLQALQVLMELAPVDAAARDYLVTQAGNGGIAPEQWSYLKQPLSGNQYFVADAVLTQYPPVANWADIQTLHIQAGNQTLYSIPSSASQTPEGIQRQLAFIDQLRGFAQGPTAQASLREARQVLELRMQRATAGQPAFTTENP